MYTHVQLGRLHVQVTPPHVCRALAPHAKPRCSDESHGYPRNDPSNNDGEAIIAGGVRARVCTAVVGTAGSACAASARRTCGGVDLHVEAAQLHVRTSSTP
eukprot:13696318-Alexandrium_andersonii.AAC.1